MFVTAITIITVITFDDEIQKKPNADEERKKLKKAAQEVTGSDKKNVFFVANSVDGQEDHDPKYKKRVLEMLEQALKCGERSIRVRQTSRARQGHKKQTRSSESDADRVKFPVENTEPPDYPPKRDWWSMPWVTFQWRLFYLDLVWTSGKDWVKEALFLVQKNMCYPLECFSFPYNDLWRCFHFSIFRKRAKRLSLDESNYWAERANQLATSVNQLNNLWISCWIWPLDVYRVCIVLQSRYESFFFCVLYCSSSVFYK